MAFQEGFYMTDISGCIYYIRRNPAGKIERTLANWMGLRVERGQNVDSAPWIETDEKSFERGLYKKIEDPEELAHMMETDAMGIRAKLEQLKKASAA